jgi:hypothetical protein
MNRALVTINYGNFLAQNSRESMQAATRRWEIDYWEFNEQTVPKWTDRAPNAMKTTVFRIGSYDEMLILDADVIVSGRCPNPFEVFQDPAEFVAVQDRSPFACQDSSWQKHVTKRPDLACPQNHETYFNTGMLLARRDAHAEAMNFACDICREDFSCSWSDQTPINIAVILKGVKVRLVDERWNFLSVQRFPDFMDIGQHPEGPYILHGAGDPSRIRWLHTVRWQ